MARQNRKLRRRSYAEQLVQAFRHSDWLGLCATARMMITLKEGPGMKPLPNGTAFRWRGNGTEPK